MPFEFAVLGPVEVRRDGELLPVPGTKQKALLAMLVLDANHVVARAQLIEGLWSGRVPPSADHSLDHYVSRLRRVLGGGRLIRRSPGYLLRVEPGELDLDRFEDLTSHAHGHRAAGDPRQALDGLRDALALVRGQPLSDVLNEPFAQVAAARLEQRCLLVREERIDVELALGGGADLVAELERLVAQHPYRERFLGALMLALYRAGRQSAALDVYRAARRRMTADLGLDPGPALAQLEARILAHDPRLSPSPPASVAPPPPPRVAEKHAVSEAPARSRLLLRPLAIGVVVVLAALIATGLGLTSHRQKAVATGTGRTSRLALIVVGRTTGRVQRSTELPSSPAAVISAYGSLWVSDGNDNEVLRISPVSGSIVDRIPVAGQPGSIVSDGGAIWVLSTLTGTVERIDSVNDSVDQTVSFGQTYSADIAVDGRNLWVANTNEHTLTELSASSGKVERALHVAGSPTGLLAVGGVLWVADYGAGTVSEVSVRNGLRLVTVNVGNGPDALAMDGHSLWVANALDSTVSRIDTRSATVTATIPVGSGPSDLIIADRSVWVTNEYVGTVDRIDPVSNVIAASVPLSGQPTALTSDGGRLWVGSGPSQGANRGGTLNLATASSVRSIDPAFYSYFGRPQFTGLAYDTLVTYAAASGADGTHLVPDLALAVPRPADGGTTYTFRLRTGIRYSNGAALRPSDFLRSFQRLFRLGSPGRDDFMSILGAGQCRREPATCDLSSGVVPDDQLGTITFHLSAPDPEFLAKLTDFAFSAPLPSGVPDHDAVLQPLPGTGPYRITSATTSEIVFDRNPFFHEWSHAAQPAGVPDRIIWHKLATHAQVIRAVLDGQDDWTLDALSPSQLHAIRTRFPSQLHSEPIFAVEFLPLNTRIAPFNHLLVRRALNLAIDRRLISKMYGGSFVASPTCQALVPGLLGYHRYCPYTRQPSTDGRYRQPNLTRARRLVAESGTRGDRINVLGASDELVVPRPVTAYVARVLRSLGYRVSAQLRSYADISARTQEHAQILTYGDWLADYPSPSSYLPSFFGCDGSDSNHYVCDPTLDREMETASIDDLARPRAAAALWAQADRRITDHGYWVPTVTDRYVDLVSGRIHNYQVSPVWGFIADQATIN